ncbi:MAG: hypothetical protein JNK05_12155 [Myxococcales bacterium]|nr:hypothetical protein [Myxococcales bacterium]
MKFLLGDRETSQDDRKRVVIPKVSDSANEFGTEIGFIHNDARTRDNLRRNSIE